MDDAAEYTSQGWHTINRGDPASAKALFEAAISRDAHNGLSWQGLSCAQSELGEHAAAIAAARRAVDIAPDFADGHVCLGSALMAAGKYRDAEAAFRKAVALPAKRRKGYLHPANAYVHLGVVLARQGRDDEAAEAYRAALAADPAHEEAMYNLAIEIRDDDPAGAIRLLYQATEIDPEYAEAYRELGFTFWQQGRNDTAERMVRRSLAINEQQPYAHVYLGLIARETRRTDEARAAFARAIELNPRFAWAHRHLGEIHYWADRLDDAERHLRIALEQNPTDALAADFLGRCLRERGGSRNMRKAEQFLRRAVSLKPQRSVAHRELGWVLENRRQYEAAEEQYRLACELGPKDAFARFCYGDFCEGVGRLSDAADLYRQALQIDTASSHAAYRLGKVLVELAQWQRAREALTRFLAFETNDARAAQVRALLMQVERNARPGAED